MIGLGLIGYIKKNWIDLMESYISITHLVKMIQIIL